MKCEHEVSINGLCMVCNPMAPEGSIQRVRFLVHYIKVLTELLAKENEARNVREEGF